MIHDSMRKMRNFFFSSLATSLSWIFYRQDMIRRSRLSLSVSDVSTTETRKVRRGKMARRAAKFILRSTLKGAKWKTGWREWM